MIIVMAGGMRSCRGMLEMRALQPDLQEVVVGGRQRDRQEERQTDTLGLELAF